MSRSSSASAEVTRYSSPTASWARTSITVAASGGGVVHQHLAVERRPGGPRPCGAAVDPGPLGQAGPDGQAPGQRRLDVGPHLVPVDRLAEAVRHGELVEGQPRSSEWALAPSTSSPLRARTPADPGEQAGPVGVDDVIVEPSARTVGCRPPSAPGARRSGSALHVVEGAALQVAAGLSTSSRTRPAFQSPQAAGPVAIESASVRACRSRRRRLGRGRLRPPAGWWRSSDRSRRVATSGSSRWWRTRSHEHLGVGLVEAHAGADRSATSSMPASVWSPGG